MAEKAQTQVTAGQTAALQQLPDILRAVWGSWPVLLMCASSSFLPLGIFLISKRVSVSVICCGLVGRASAKEEMAASFFPPVFSLRSLGGTSTVRHNPDSGLPDMIVSLKSPALTSGDAGGY